MKVQSILLYILCFMSVYGCASELVPHNDSHGKIRIDLLTKVDVDKKSDLSPTGVVDCYTCAIPPMLNATCVSVPMYLNDMSMGKKACSGAAKKYLSMDSSFEDFEKAFDDDFEKVFDSSFLREESWPKHKLGRVKNHYPFDNVKNIWEMLVSPCNISQDQKIVISEQDWDDLNALAEVHGHDSFLHAAIKLVPVRLKCTGVVTLRNKPKGYSYAQAHPKIIADLLDVYVHFKKGHDDLYNPARDSYLSNLISFASSQGKIGSITALRSIGANFDFIPMGCNPVDVLQNTIEKQMEEDQESCCDSPCDSAEMFASSLLSFFTFWASK